MALSEVGRRKRAGGREEMKYPEVNGKEWNQINRIKQTKTELKHIPNKTDKASSNSKQD